MSGRGRRPSTGTPTTCPSSPSALAPAVSPPGPVADRTIWARFPGCPVSCCHTGAAHSTATTPADQAASRPSPGRSAGSWTQRHPTVPTTQAQMSPAMPT